MPETGELVPWVIGGGASGWTLGEMMDLDTAMQAGAAVGGGVAGVGTAFAMDRLVSDATSATVGGGVAGGTTTAVVRDQFDVRGGAQAPLVGDPGTTIGRLGLPSVLWGGVTGLGSLAAWWITMGPRAFDDALLGYGLGGVGAATVSALLPKQPGGGGGGGGGSTPERQRPLKRIRDGGSKSGDGGGGFSLAE